jgi:lipoprotein signal peptidase
LVAGLYALDQATKLWTAGLDLQRPGWPVLPQRVELGDGFPVIPGWFHWVHFSNTGAAFGILQDSNKFFIGLSLAALFGLGWSLKKNVFPGRLNFVALLLLIAGASLAAIGAALVSQHVFDMQPCPWCVLQRAVFAAMALVALAGALVPQRLVQAAILVMLDVLESGDVDVSDDDGETVAAADRERLTVRVPVIVRV